MGFDLNSIKLALESSNNNVEIAIKFLTQEGLLNTNNNKPIKQKVVNL